MERKRSQYQRYKQQKQQRFCVSQQDLTQALNRMKPMMNCFQERRYESLKSFSSTPSIEKIDNRSVSKLVQEFEARANIISYASTQNLFRTANDVISNDAEFNHNHMLTQTIKPKDENNDNRIINNNVCSLISSCTVNDNQMVKENIKPDEHTGDKEQEKKDEPIYETLDIDYEKLDLPPPPPSFYATIEKNNHSKIDMVTRSTNLDEAAKTFGQQNKITFDQLLVKEAQLHRALADLLAISNNTNKSLLTKSPTKKLQQRPILNVKNDTNASSTNAFLNNLLDEFDFNKEKIGNSSNKNRHSQINNDGPVKPINMFR